MDDKSKNRLKREAGKALRRGISKRKGKKTGRGGWLIPVLILILLGALILTGVFTGFFRRGEVVGYDESKLSVAFLDVGQGDSILIRSPGGRFLLIDAGKNSAATKLTGLLRQRGVKTIDYFILTHPDEDHIGGADVVLREFEVRTVLSSDAGAATKAWRDVLDAIDDEGCADITVTPGAVYTFFEGCRFTVLGPPDTGDASSLNNQSVVVRLDYGGTSFLFTGDAEKEEETAMMKRFGGEDFRADVLKVGHHGSSSSSGEEFLAAVRPSFAVISCGKDNAYAHPHAAALKRLEAVGAQILRTDESGTVVLQSDGQTVQVVDAAEPSPFEALLERIKGWFR